MVSERSQRGNLDMVYVPIAKPGQRQTPAPHAAPIYNTFVRSSDASTTAAASHDDLQSWRKKADAASKLLTFKLYICEHGFNWCIMDSGV